MFLLLEVFDLEDLVLDDILELLVLADLLVDGWGSLIVDLLLDLLVVGLGPGFGVEVNWGGGGGGSREFLFDY